jgi:hypothetical protein
VTISREPASHPARRHGDAAGTSTLASPTTDRTPRAQPESAGRPASRDDIDAGHEHLRGAAAPGDACGPGENWPHRAGSRSPACGAPNRAAGADAEIEALPLQSKFEYVLNVAAINPRALRRVPMCLIGNYPFDVDLDAWQAPIRDRPSDVSVLFHCRQTRLLLRRFEQGFLFGRFAVASSEVYPMHKNKLIAGLGLVMIAALGTGACSSSSSSPPATLDAGPDVTMGEDSGSDAGEPDTSTAAEAGDAARGDAEPEAGDAAVDGGDAAPTEAGIADAGDAAVGDAE